MSRRSKELFAEFTSLAEPIPQEVYDVITNDQRLADLTAEYDVYFNALAAHIDDEGREMLSELEEIRTQIDDVLICLAYHIGKCAA